MEIKVCGMRDTKNIQSLLDEVAPDWMGVIFYPKSPRFVSEKYADQFVELPVRTVGVFVNASKEEVLSKVVQFGLSAVQLHGDESSEFVEELRNVTSLEIWKVVSVKEDIDWRLYESYLKNIDRFLFDTSTKNYGGSGKKFDWSILADYPFEKPFLLSGGIDEESAEDILKIFKAQPLMLGVDVNSRFEIEAANKNIVKLKRFKKRILGLAQ